jgi:hypothetical protein
VIVVVVVVVVVVVIVVVVVVIKLSSRVSVWMNTIPNIFAIDQN